MVSFPVIPVYSAPSDAVTVNSTGNKLANSQIVYYDPVAVQYYTGAQTDFQELGTVGQGYWVSLLSSSTLSINGCAPANSSLDVEIARGWNMFGNPFTTNVKWDDTKVQVIKSGGSVFSLSDAVSRGWIADRIYTYTGSGYQEILTNNGSNIEPWKAYWLKAYENVNLRFNK
jgi:hypothetical protein